MAAASGKGCAQVRGFYPRLCGVLCFFFKPRVWPRCPRCEGCEAASAGFLPSEELSPRRWATLHDALVPKNLGRVELTQLRDLWRFSAQCEFEEGT